MHFLDQTEENFKYPIATWGCVISRQSRPNIEHTHHQEPFNYIHCWCKLLSSQFLSSLLLNKEEVLSISSNVLYFSIWATCDYDQNLFLTLCSMITSDSAQETICAKNWTYVGHVQSKGPTFCSISVVPIILFLISKMCFCHLNISCIFDYLFLEHIQWCLGFTPRFVFRINFQCAQGTKWDGRNWTQGGHIQSKHSTRCTP